MNRARNADQAARTCERLAYSIVKTTRLYGYHTLYMGNSRGAQRYVGFVVVVVVVVVVIVVVVVDCAFPMLIAWVGKLRSNGYYCKHDEPAWFGTTVQHFLSKQQIHSFWMSR